MHYNQTPEGSTNPLQGMCIRTYLDLLGHQPTDEWGDILEYQGVIPGSETVLVFHSTNTYIDASAWPTRKVQGRVPDLAAAIHGTTVDQVLQYPSRYKLDLLIERCGDRTGPLWEPLDPEPQDPETSDYMPY